MIKDGDFIGIIDLVTKSYLDVKNNDANWVVFNVSKDFFKFEERKNYLIGEQI